MRLILSLLAAALLPFSIHAAPAHVHGAGTLNITVDGNQLTLSLESPLDAFVGFERPPRTAREKADYAAMVKALNDAAALFTPTVEAGCTAKSVKVNAPFLNGKPSADGHGDIDADYVFQCAKPAALKGVETNLFKSFSRLYRLEVRRAGPGGQGAGQLTPKNPGLSWQ